MPSMGRPLSATDAIRAALLDLKMAGIRRLSYEEFFQLLAADITRTCAFTTTLRQELPATSRQFWDQRLHWWAATL